MVAPILFLHRRDVVVGNKFPEGAKRVGMREKLAYVDQERFLFMAKVVRICDFCFAHKSEKIPAESAH